MTALEDNGREAVGERLRRIRKAAGITQGELARRTGLRPETISRIELGRLGMGIDSARPISEEFGVSIEWLRYGDQEPRSSQVEYSDRNYAAWTEFLASPLGQTMSDDERETLESIRFRSGRPTVLLYQSFLIAMRQGLNPDPDSPDEARRREHEAQGKKLADGPGRLRELRRKKRQQGKG